MSKDTPNTARKTRRGFVRTVAAAGAVAGMSGVALAGEEKDDDCDEEKEGERKKDEHSKKDKHSKKDEHRDKEGHKDKGNPKNEERPDVEEKKKKMKDEAPDVNG